ncbi:MAG TPA: hypothetical protein VFK23_08145, partial [Nitrospirota bacterium]|nr:hypothetical protein [Nitrospirota bacterium]
MATRKATVQKRKVKKGTARPAVKRVSSGQGVKKMKANTLKSVVKRPAKIQSINPYTEQVMQEFPLMSRQEVDWQLKASH